MAAKRLRLPATVWMAWCQTCAAWLDEDTTAKYAASLARNEHPEHLARDPKYPEMSCVVYVVPFHRGHSSKWKRVRALPRQGSVPRGAVMWIVKAGDKYWSAPTMLWWHEQRYAKRYTSRHEAEQQLKSLGHPDKRVVRLVRKGYDIEPALDSTEVQPTTTKGTP